MFVDLCVDVLVSLPFLFVVLMLLSSCGCVVVVLMVCCCGGVLLFCFCRLGCCWCRF